MPSPIPSGGSEDVVKHVQHLKAVCEGVRSGDKLDGPQVEQLRRFFSAIAQLSLRQAAKHVWAGENKETWVSPLVAGLSA
jgi:uncharacterized protein YfaT (DUF1175 family)